MDASSSSITCYVQQGLLPRGMRCLSGGGPMAVASGPRDIDIFDGIERAQQAREGGAHIRLAELVEKITVRPFRDSEEAARCLADLKEIRYRQLSRRVCAHDSLFGKIVAVGT